jgi:hypothetical protein
MEENLVGYVLDALDPDTQRRVETYLQGNPEGIRQVELLRQALEPLRADAQEIEPPPGLAVRTLARVAEYCCRDLPRAPAPSRRFGEGGRPRWYRRADMLVAASILLCLVLVIPPVLSRFQHQHELACSTVTSTTAIFRMWRVENLASGKPPGWWCRSSLMRVLSNGRM